MRILVTGGCGFIGGNLVHHLLKAHPEDEVINLDALTYAGCPESLADVAGDPRYTFVHGDICDRELVESLMPRVDAVMHLAAESHVDRSLTDPGAFVRTNVLGTQVLLEAARHAKVERFLHVSTDEVYGSLGETGFFTETTPYAPNSPYSASKAGSDLLVRAYHETFGMPVLLTNCSNNYGPYHFPEKLLPLFITNLIDGQLVPVYGDGLNVRDWLHVQDHVEALDLVLRRGVPGERYNIGGHNEWTNMAITREILKRMDRDDSFIRFVQDRPGHDRRYAIDAGKIERELGWRPRYTFEQGLQETIDWYRANEAWWRPLKARGLDQARARSNAMAAHPAG
ncbi:MAG: dTDP-glucose 4,6-dehydratase [bacterium]|nr:dTDP-glucose 4,6-dehydratase [bacterium]